jgi:hypothetical protein
MISRREWATTIAFLVFGVVFLAGIVMVSTWGMPKIVACLE